MSEPKGYRTRRKFIFGSFLLGFASLFKVAPLKASTIGQPGDEETVRMITADGKLVDVPKKLLKGARKDRSIDKDLNGFKNTDSLHRSKIKTTDS